MGIFFKDVPTRKPDVPPIIGPLFEETTTRVPTKFGQFAKNWLLPILQSGLDAAMFSGPGQPGESAFAAAARGIINAQLQRDGRTHRDYQDALEERRLALEEGRLRQSARPTPYGKPVVWKNEAGEEALFQIYSDGSFEQLPGVRPLPRPVAKGNPRPMVQNIGEGASGRGIPHVFNEASGSFEEARVTDPLSVPAGPPVGALEFPAMPGGEVPVEGMPAASALLPQPANSGIPFPLPAPRRPTVLASEADRILTPRRGPTPAEMSRKERKKFNANVNTLVRHTLGQRAVRGNPKMAVAKLEELMLDPNTDMDLVMEAIARVRKAYPDHFRHITGSSDNLRDVDNDPRIRNR